LPHTADTRLSYCSFDEAALTGRSIRYLELSNGLPSHQINVILA